MPDFYGGQNCLGASLPVHVFSPDPVEPVLIVVGDACCMFVSLTEKNDVLDCPTTIHKGGKAVFACESLASLHLLVPCLWHIELEPVGSARQSRDHHGPTIFKHYGITRLLKTQTEHHASTLKRNQHPQANLVRRALISRTPKLAHARPRGHRSRVETIRPCTRKRSVQASMGSPECIGSTRELPEGY